MTFDFIVSELKGFSDTPALDARIFCEGRSLTSEQITDFIKRRKCGEPVSKIIGEKGFYKSVFKTSVDVLDPRPDSETIIEAVLQFFPNHTQSLKILDVGTGSGCLLATLLQEYPHAEGIGIDLSEKALQIARKNLNGLPAKLVQKDFMKNDWNKDLGVFDVIISNPPYIPSNEIENLDLAVKKYDPLIALDGGSDGLNAYRQLSKTLPLSLTNGGKVVYEIGQGQENDVVEIMHESSWKFVSSLADLAGITRVLLFES